MGNTVGLVPFPILPTMFGGADRCWNVLSRLGPINIHGLSWEGTFTETQTIGDVRYRIHPASADAIRRAQSLSGFGFVTYDAMAHMARKYLDDFQRAIDAEQPDLIVLEHPWLVDFVGDVPYIFDAHNSEATHYMARFGDQSPEFAHIKLLEKRAIEGAALVTYCSEADFVRMNVFHGYFEGLHVPNGVNLPDISGRSPSNVLLFIGSNYPPNIEAAWRLNRLAASLPDYRIVIAGGCSYKVQPLGSNVEVLGVVSDERLHELFLEAFAFVNLMSVGSGTHLKVGRALSYGVPVITTEVGARGYSSPIVTSQEAISDTLRMVAGDYDRLSAEALREASGLSWDSVVEPVREWIRARG